MKTAAKILFVFVMAFLTVAMFASPDGAKIVKDIDREVFTGTSAMTAGVVWLVMLRVLFKKKKTAEEPAAA